MYYEKAKVGIKISENKDDWSAIRERVTVLGDQEDVRYAAYSYSEFLMHYRIAHTGVITTEHPYELTRINQSGGCLVVTLDGVGKVLVNGKWVILRPNEACFLPAFVNNSIQSIEGESWTFGWVKYLESPDSKPMVPAVTPVRGVMEGDAIKYAILGLNASLESSSTKSLENLWVELIHQQVVSFAKPKAMDSRLWSLWQEVAKSLDEEWSLERMSEFAGMSKEHLRRLCQQEYGRSAKKQLLHLRMRKARILLLRHKVELVASAVGYSDVSTFSNVFKQHMGFRPSSMKQS